MTNWTPARRRAAVIGAWLVAPLLLVRCARSLDWTRAAEVMSTTRPGWLIVAVLAILPDLFGHWRMGPWPLIGLAILAIVGYKKGWWGQHRASHSGNPWHQATTPTTPTQSTPPAAPPNTPPSEAPQDAPRV